MQPYGSERAMMSQISFSDAEFAGKHQGQPSAEKKWRRRSFDDPIGAPHHRLRNPDADGAGHFQVDYQLKSRGPLQRQIGELGTVEIRSTK